MEKTEINQLLEEILENIASLNASVSGLTYEEFEQDEVTKEMVYEYLQDIGRNARDLVDNTELPEDMEIDQLTKLYDARYNQEIEIENRDVFLFIQTDLQEIGERIEQSSLYLNRE